jgi:hypothetical protein
MPAPVVHFEITGQDAPKLHSFYSDLFDWNIDANNEWNYGLVAPNGESGLRGGIGPSMDQSSHVTVYMQVPDLEAALAKAESLGGKTIQPPMEVPGVVTMALFADPAGNMIGLIKGA